MRKQKWQIKKRELELIASRNHVLPRLDAFARYRWNGFGDDLFAGGPADGRAPAPAGTNAFDTLTGGNYQDWQLGLQLNVPIGYRKPLAQVRHHELLLAKARAVMQDMELEVSHQLGDAIRDIELFNTVSQTNFNRLVAAEKEVKAVEAALQADKVTLDLVLDAQRRRSDAETAYYRSLVDYNRGVMNVHYRKGSLLEYNGVYLAEGPWPGKAYFDALREARKRDASKYLDYGFTRPNVFSRGPYQQPDVVSEHGSEYYHGEPIEIVPDAHAPEEIWTPGPVLDSNEASRVVEPTSSAAVRRPATQVYRVNQVSHTEIPQAGTATSTLSTPHETISNYSSSPTAATASGRTRSQRGFAGSGVRR